MQITAILLLSCPDQSGIVAEISAFIFHHSGNILHSDQHTDSETNTYFMRIEWDLEKFDLSRNGFPAAFQPIADKFRMQWSIRYSDTRLKTAIFVSKLDHCLYDLLIRNASGELPMQIELIVANHPDLKPIADYFKIEFRYLPMNAENKSAVEAEEAKLLTERAIDLIVLARYMQILSPEFVSRYKNRIINIHHSFLPAFVGAKPYHQAYLRGVKIIGATSHYVTEDLDQGPIIEQDVARVSHRDGIDDLVRKGKDLEKLVLSRAVKLHLQSKIAVFGNKTMIFD